MSVLFAVDFAMPGASCRTSAILVNSFFDLLKSWWSDGENRRSATRTADMKWHRKI
jgi:hypothetical protein